MQIATNHHDANGDVTAATSAVIAAILGDPCRSSSLLYRGHAEIDRLMRSGARIDAALTLIALELPQWQLRRIVYDGGEWHCALSRARELADWLDQSAEGRHADLALALLDAVVEARQIAAASDQTDSPPQPADATDVLLGCDNFS
jgi:hypothetical protein